MDTWHVFTIDAYSGREYCALCNSTLLHVKLLDTLMAKIANEVFGTNREVPKAEDLLDFRHPAQVRVYSGNTPCFDVVQSERGECIRKLDEELRNRALARAMRVVAY